MTGLQALVFLEQGKKITCKHWNNRTWYLSFTEYSGFTFSMQSEEFPRVPSMNPVTPWTNFHNQEVIEIFLRDIFEHEWEVIE